MLRYNAFTKYKSCVDVFFRQGDSFEKFCKNFSAKNKT